MCDASAPVWLVTGCTSGFGKEACHQLIEQSALVVGAGRNVTERCQSLIDIGVSMIDLDLTWDSDKISEAVQEAVSIHGHIDYLINNAGYVAMDFFEEISTDRLVDSFSANYFGTCHITRAVFASMRQRRSGKIAFMGSMNGWEGNLGLIAYSTAKFALEALSEVLSQEGALFNIQTIIFEPGVTNTGITAKCAPARGLKNPLYNDVHRLGDEFMRTFQPPGETQKVVARMIEVLTGTGVAQGRLMPRRLPLGSDALGLIRRKCEETLRLCKEWEEVIVSTDCESVGKGKGAAVATPFGDVEENSDYGSMEGSGSDASGVQTPKNCEDGEEDLVGVGARGTAGLTTTEPVTEWPRRSGRKRWSMPGMGVAMNA